MRCMSLRGRSRPTLMLFSAEDTQSTSFTIVHLWSHTWRCVGELAELGRQVRAGADAQPRYSPRLAEVCRLIVGLIQVHAAHE